MRIEPAPYLEDLRAAALSAPAGDHPVALVSEGRAAIPFNRYSVLAAAPAAILSAAGPGEPIRVRGESSGQGTLPDLRAAVAWARQLMGGRPATAPRPAAGPRPPHVGGLIGYLSYESGARLTRMPLRAPEGGMPELWLGLYPRIYVADHGRREAWLASRPAACEAPRAAARRREALEAWIEAACALSRRPEPRAAAEEPRGDWRETWEPSLNPGRYRRAVARILEYLRAGDAYQVNLTVRYRRTARADPRRIFASLLEVNPAPFSAMILGEGWAALSSSPELFLDLGPRGTLQTRPIKGTRARGAGAEARSAAGEEALLASEKDRAEHVMIVDLERNDVGGVARYGTVRVEPFLAVERFPGLDHLVSTVSGRMRPGLGIADALAALFPGGSVTGAPKIRAMEIIHELEPAPRGLYCGALGWIAPEGEARLNLPIRTMAWREGRLDLHVGGGIVADSDPEAEDAECRVKGEAIARAVERAEESAGPAGGREDQAARGGRPFATERLLAR